MFKHHDKHSLGVSRYLQDFTGLSTAITFHFPKALCFQTSPQFQHFAIFRRPISPKNPWDFWRTGRVHMKQDYMGRPSGEVFVEFISTEEARCLFVCSEQEIQRF